MQYFNHKSILESTLKLGMYEVISHECCQFL